MEGKYVFISYKVEDSDDAVWVKETLEYNGIPCWMAPDSIPGGSSYATEIENAIMNCTAFVLVLSERAQKSKWVSKEVDRAINYGKRVMPFTLDNSPLISDFAFYLSNVQRYDATTNKPEAMKTLHADIIKEFNSPTTATVFKKKPPKKHTEKNTLKNKIQKILIVIGILTILSYILAFWIGFSDDSPSDEDISSGVAESNETSTYSDQNHPSDNFYDFTQATNNSALSIHQYLSKDNFFFFLDGVQFRLPCSYSELKNNG